MEGVKKTINQIIILSGLVINILTVVLMVNVSKDNVLRLYVVPILNAEDMLDV